MKRLHIRATVIQANGQRVRIDAVCSARSEIDRLVEQHYPDARRVSIIVTRKEGSS